MPATPFFQRFKERKLFQWAVAYLCGAWVVVEGASLVVDQFGWSTAIAQTVTVLAFFGFFVVLVISWYHGEKGRQWVSGPELLMIALLLLISGGVLSMLNRGDKLRETGRVEMADPVETKGPSIAVLPCANMSPDAADEYLALGFHDEILLKLQRIPSLLSIGRTSVLQYAESPPATSEIASALGVRFVGECSVRKIGGRVRVIFQLLAGATGEQVWADDFDRDLTVGDLLDIQGEIAQQVAQAVGAVLTPEDQAEFSARPTENTEAYRLYLEGRFWLPNRTRESYVKAVDLFSSAVTLDPTFALGFAALASAHSMAEWYQWVTPVSDAHDLATRAVQRALELDPGLPDAHQVLGSLARHDWRWEEAEAHYWHSVELSPMDSETHRLLGLLLLHQGRFPESHAELTKAIEYDPLSAMANYNLGDLLSAMGRANEAVPLLKENLEKHPGHRSTIGALQRALYFRGKFDEAVSLSPNSPQASFSLVALGRESEVIRQMEQIESEGRVPSTLFFAAIGDYDRFFEILEQAIQSRRPALAWTSVDPFLESLHDDPRWEEFLNTLRGFEGSKR